MVMESDLDLERDEVLIDNLEAEEFPVDELLTESINEIYDNENNSNQQNSDELLSGNESIINNSSSSMGSYSQQSPDANELDNDYVEQNHSDQESVDNNDRSPTISQISDENQLDSVENESFDDNYTPSIDPSATLQHFEDVAEESDLEADDDNYLSEDTDDSETDVPAEEVERMLEDALGVGASGRTDGTGRKRTANQAGFDKKKPFEEKEKKVLMEKEFHHFDVLPEGWIQVTHHSGLHIYLHKAGRVCSLARPYFLGPGDAKKHDIPLSGIPCLSYKKALENEEAATAAAEAEKQNPPKSEELPSARIETIRENIEQNNLKPQQVNEYARRRFTFETTKVTAFKSSAKKSRKSRKQTQDRQLQRPTLPEGTKLISFPVLSNDTDDNNKNQKREWIMNPNGKSYVCILHEYIQHALKKQPTYKFAEIDDVATPYSATVTINDMQYGIGHGSSKKQAKSAAAKATLEMLIPEMRTKIATDARMGGAAVSKACDQDLSLFDEIKVEDPRVAEFCAKTTEPSPHDVLLTCLQRNFGLGDLQISYQGNTLKHQRNEFTMRVGKHSATVVCKNKRDGKQRASQAILQALHPHITSWGALLRLYGTRSVKSFKEKKMEEQEITLLQSKAAVNQPNFAILDKLRLELNKINDRKSSKNAGPRDVQITTADLPNVSACPLNGVDL